MKRAAELLRRTSRSACTMRRAGAWWLAAEQDAVLLFPLHERNGTPRETLDAAREIRIPLEQADVQRIETGAHADPRGGNFLRSMRSRRCALALKRARGMAGWCWPPIRPSARSRNLMEHGLAQFRAVYDLLDCTGPAFEVRCRQGGELIPKGYGVMQVFPRCGRADFCT